MEDGSVVISILGDRKHIAKELEATRKDIEKTEKKLAEKVSAKSGIEASLDEAMKAASATNDKIKALKREYSDLTRVMADKSTSATDYSRAASRQAAITKELQLQTPILKAQDADVDKLHSKYESVSAEVERLTSNLAIAKEKAADLASQEEQAKVGEAVRKQLDKASESAERFQKRMLQIGRSALLYNIFSSSLRNAVSYFGQLLNTSKEYQTELAKLKGALVNAFQPLYAQILPWAVSLLRILTSIVQVVGNFLSLLFGVGTLGDGEKSTGMLKSQAAAISGVGAAAKEAGKQLASFDQINKLGGNNSSSGGGGAGGGVSPDLSGLKSEEYQRELNRLTAILSGALLALGAILFFTGTNIPLGLALMAAGAIGLVNLSTGKWGEVTDDLKKTLSVIFGILSGAFLVIGAILLFSGGPLNIARGIAMVAIGAAALVGLAYVNWNTIPDRLKETASSICVVGGIVCVALGIVMLFTGRPMLGIGLILTGIGLLGAAAAVISWTDTPEKLKEIATEICVIGGIVFVATGIALLFTGHVGLGIGMILAGAGFLGAAAAINWGSLTAPLARGAYAICKLGGAVLIAVGMALLFSGAGISLGLGLILAGLATEKLADAIPWNDEAGKKDLLATIDSVTTITGTLLAAVGMVLLFSGAGTAIGLGMLAAGAGMLWASYSTDYDDSEIVAMTNRTASKIASAKTSGKTVGEFAQATWADAEKNEGDDAGAVLYRALSNELHLTDDDIRSLGFNVIGSGSDAFISGLVRGIEDNDTKVSDILARSMVRSVNEAALKMDEGALTSEVAAKILNARIQELLESGLMTEEEIAASMNSDTVQDTLSRMGLSFTDGYIHGMDKDAVAQEARDMTQGALDAIAEAQDSHSPSKKTASLAKDAVDGYVNELAASDGRVRTAGQSMVDSLTNGILSRTSVLDAALAHIVDSANAMASSVVTAVNVAVEAMTSVSYTGSTIRIPAPTLYSLKSTPLPKLATGAVIPPNAPFAAILGDQRSGTNIEAPLSTIQQAVSGVVRGDEQISLLKEQNRLLMAILERADVKLDGRSIAESTTSYQRQMSRASGGDGHGRI